MNRTEHWAPLLSQPGDRLGAVGGRSRKAYWKLLSKTPGPSGTSSCTSCPGRPALSLCAVGWGLRGAGTGRGLGKRHPLGSFRGLRHAPQIAAAGRPQRCPLSGLPRAAPPSFALDHTGCTRRCPAPCFGLDQEVRDPRAASTRKTVPDGAHATAAAPGHGLGLALPSARLPVPCSGIFIGVQGSSVKGTFRYTLTFAFYFSHFLSCVYP